jgi:ATP/maltotriose-dependent transcriptional regulator MalT
LLSVADELSAALAQLSKMHLDQSAFLVVSVVGQVLLEAGSFQSSVKVLESALRIGTCSQKLKGSVFSALSNAHWALGQMDRALVCMRQDLTIAKALGMCQIERYQIQTVQYPDS